MKKSDVSSLVVYAIMLVVLFCTFFFGVRDTLGKTFEGFANIGVALLTIVISFIVSSLLLEIGHVLGAKAGKYDIIAFNFLYFMFYKVNGKRKFKFSGPDGLFSETKVAPRVNENGEVISKPKAMLWLGNLFVALFIIAAAIVYVRFQGNTGMPYLSPIALMAAVSAGCVLFYNFLPLELDNKTDGAQLKIVSKAANLKAFNENLRIKACELSGENPGDVQVFDEITNYTANINMVTAYKLLGEEKYDEALKIINHILEKEDSISERIRIEMVAQKLYILLYTQQIEKAKKYYEDITPEDKRFISNANGLVYIRTYVLISGILDPAESEVQYATSKADKGYKRVEALKKPVEAMLYKNSVKRIKELHPNWEPVIKDEK